MLPTQKIKKFLVFSILTAFLGSVFVSVNLANASAGGDFNNWVEGLMEEEEEGVSFVQYAGSLPSLEDIEDIYGEILTVDSDLRTFVIRIVNFLLGFLGLFAVVIVIYGGTLYVASGGDEEKTTKGKKAITYATIGIIIVVGAYAFVNTLIKGITEDDVAGSGNYVTGYSTGLSFNAAAEQVKSIAGNLLKGFSHLIEITEDFKGIKSDAAKISINPANLPSKPEILAFLKSIKNKLNGIASDYASYSSTYANVNEMIREIDQHVDYIENLPSGSYDTEVNLNKGLVYYNNNVDWTDQKGVEPEEFCDKKVANDTEEAFADIGDSMKELCAELEDDLKSTGGGLNENVYTVPYIRGLYAYWYELHKAFLGETSTYWKVEGQEDAAQKPFYDVLADVKEDYYRELEYYLVVLDNVLSPFLNITAANLEGKDGTVGYYDTFKNNSDFGYNITDGGTASGDSGNIGKKLNSTGGFTKGIKDWKINSSIDTVGGLFINGWDTLMGDIYTTLANIKVVDVKLAADVVQGSAPLAVTFNVVNSVDPAGGTIREDSIDWDLVGNKTNEELLLGVNMCKLKLGDESSECPSDIDEKQNDNVRCDAVDVGAETKNEKGVISNTTKRCIYQKPGTYVVAVKISSNDPTTYADGLGTLTIVVRPPENKINLTVNGDYVSKYKGENLTTDKSEISIITSEAKSVDFEVTTANLSSCEIDFGDGDIAKTESIDSKGCSFLEHEYEEKGRYEVILKVTNKLGITDKKIFTLNITSVVSRPTASPPSGAGYIGQNITFDGNDSVSTKGIKNYKWSIEALTDLIPWHDDISEEKKEKILELIEAEYGKQGEPKITESSPTFAALTHQFKYPITYKVKLTVTDNSNETGEDEIIYKVISSSPVASFSYEVTDPAQPQAIHFDASKSYDIDDHDYDFEWSVVPQDEVQIINEKGEAIDYDASELNGVLKPIIKFNNMENGEYEMTLKVFNLLNPGDEFDEFTEILTIEDRLDIAFAKDQEIVGILKDEGNAAMIFKIVSVNGVAYEIDFGDGITENGDLDGEDIEHIYTGAGKVKVKVTVFDLNDNSNSLERTFHIAGGDNPIPIATILINGAERFGEVIEVNRKDEITFDASKSVNTDGTGRKLKYSWDFGGGDLSTEKIKTHKFKQTTPTCPPECYEVVLKVTDEGDASKNSDENPYKISFNVIDMDPVFSAVQAVLSSASTDAVTPVDVNLTAVDALDPDGQILSYRWWYFLKDMLDEQFGIQIGQEPSATLQVGSHGGLPGDEQIVGFGLEVTDAEGNKFSNIEEIKKGNWIEFPTTISENELPIAIFKVDKTNVLVGEPVVFTSSSTDEDGDIEYFIYDVEGDGFFNNDPITESNLEHIYEKVNLEGYPVRLTVRDNQGGESVSSEPIRIYVSTNSKPPTAAFITEPAEGLSIKIIDNSTADEEAGASIMSYAIDKNIAKDSDGDGDPTNDIDYKLAEPTITFEEKGTYEIKLTVTQNDGQIDDVINSVTVPLADPPTAAFTYVVEGDTVKFTNNSTADTENNAEIVEDKTWWDFDTASTLETADTSGNGNKEDDKDSTEYNPIHKYLVPGIYMVQLTVEDSFTGIGKVVKEVKYELPTADIPTADFTYVIEGDTVKFTNTSTADTANNAELVKSMWNFDTASSLENNVDSTEENPIKKYQELGVYKVKLTVEDNFGNTSDILKEINYTGSTPDEPIIEDDDDLLAVLTSDPPADESGVIHLEGDSASVKFYFRESKGPISYYIFDKNTYYDSPNDTDATKDNDIDIKLDFGGTYTTHYNNTGDKIGVKLTVLDLYSNEHSARLEIQFD